VRNQDNVEITVYPNPCKNRLFIEQEIPIELVEIYSPKGELLESRMLKESNRVELSIDLPSGLYFLSIYSKEQKVTERFVVEN
jgi:hypothetical protein